MITASFAIDAVRKLTASYIRFARNSQRSLATLATKQKTCAKRTPHLCFYSPVRRLDQPQVSGDLGEHCSSSAGRYVLCASPGRVAQPRLLAADRGNRVAAANGGRLLWVTFLAKTRKVTGCRATPGGFDFFILRLRSGRTALVSAPSPQPSPARGEGATLRTATTTRIAGTHQSETITLPTVAALTHCKSFHAIPGLTTQALRDVLCRA